MIRKKQLVDQAFYYLGFIKGQVELNSTLRLTDINKHAEVFYRDLLNLIEGLELRDINIEEPNAAAIDLGDRAARIAIQVTSTQDISKIKSTFSTFIRRGLDREYDQLVVLNICEAGSHRTKSLDDASGFQFLFERDLWDMRTIISRLGACDLAVIEKVVDYLRENVRLTMGAALPNEELTILALIETLSEESEASSDVEFIEEPDPEGKIEKRFADHANFLKSEFMDLREEYGSLLEDILKDSSPTRAQIRKMQKFLKRTSDRTLTEERDDPENALDKLTRRYGQLLADRGVSYDVSAIRFFLLDQLIKCNVFPNRVAADV